MNELVTEIREISVNSKEKYMCTNIHKNDKIGKKNTYSDIYSKYSEDESKDRKSSELEFYLQHDKKFSIHMSNIGEILKNISKENFREDYLASKRNFKK